MDIKIKNPTELVGIFEYYFFNRLKNFSRKRIKIEAKIAPVTLAKTSKTSAFLVFVKIPCPISIKIPKEKEAKKTKVFKFGFCGFSLVEKYKYHRKTKTK